MLQRVIVCCSVLQSWRAHEGLGRHFSEIISVSVLQLVVCSALQHVAACHSVLQSVAVRCSMLQRVVVCCSVLQYWGAHECLGRHFS